MIRGGVTTSSSMSVAVAVTATPTLLVFLTFLGREVMRRGHTAKVYRAGRGDVLASLTVLVLVIKE